MAFLDIIIFLFAAFPLLCFAYPASLYLMDLLNDWSQLATFIGLFVSAWAFGRFTGLLSAGVALLDAIIIEPRVRAAVEASKAEAKRNSLLTSANYDDQLAGVVGLNDELTADNRSLLAELAQTRVQRDAAQNSIDQARRVRDLYKREAEAATDLVARLRNEQSASMGAGERASTKRKIAQLETERGEMCAKWIEASTEARLQRREIAQLQADKIFVERQCRQVIGVEVALFKDIVALKCRVRELERRSALSKEVSLLDI